MKLFISSPPHLESLLAEELKELGISTSLGRSGVFAPLSIENVYKINYLSRLATRVFWPLKQFSCRNREDLYRETAAFPWEKLFKKPPFPTFAIDSNISSNQNLTHSHFASLVVKDAICDRLKNSFQERPSIDVKNPQIQLNLFLHREEALLSFDTSNAPLYKRGWRQEGLTAPLQENLAAAILRLALYKGDEILCDPCCGSGTFLVEAAMIQTKTPPGFWRKHWGFYFLPEHQEEIFQKIKKEANQKIIPMVPKTIFGADVDSRAASEAQSQAHRAGFPILVAKSPLSLYKPPQTPTLIITNPPYGKRIQGSSVKEEVLQFAEHMRAKAFLLIPAEDTSQGKTVASLLNGGIETSLKVYNEQP